MDGEIRMTDETVRRIMEVLAHDYLRGARTERNCLIVEALSGKEWRFDLIALALARLNVATLWLDGCRERATIAKARARRDDT